MSARWIGLAAGAALLLIFALTCRPQPAGISMNPISWSESPQTLSGTAPPLSEVNVRVDGDVAGQTQADDQGRWSMKMPRDLSRSVVSVEARTSRGEVASASLRSPGSEASAAPPTARQYPSEFPGAPRPLTIAEPTAQDPQPQAGVLRVRGLGQPGTSVNILADGQILGEAVVDPEGVWQKEVTLTSPARRISAAVKGSSADVVWQPAMSEPPASSAKPLSTEAGQPVEHLIVAGDTLSLISAKYNIKMRRLCQLNRILNPDLICAGKTLRLR